MSDNERPANLPISRSNGNAGCLPYIVVVILVGVFFWTATWYWLVLAGLVLAMLFVQTMIEIACLLQAIREVLQWRKLS